MNENYRLFIEGGKVIAQENGLEWHLPYDPKTGKIQNKPVDFQWNISALRSDRGVAHKLSSFRMLNKYIDPGTAQSKQNLSDDWQDFLKAAILDQAFRKQNKAQHSVQNIGRPIRILGSVAGEIPPWEITADIVRTAYNLTIQSSPKGAMNLEMMIRTVVDIESLADRSPLARFCEANSNEKTTSAAQKVAEIKTKSNRHKQQFKRSRLTDRKNAEKLPEARAFWELVRILFSESPKFFVDAVSFELAKIALFAGARANEIASLPYECLRYRDVPIKKKSEDRTTFGFERALYLSIFASKQKQNSSDSRTVLVRTAMAVPIDQEVIIKEAVERIKYLTEPMRNTIKRQREKNRIFPQYEPNQLVSIIDLHPALTGNLWFLDDDPPLALTKKYRSSWSHEDRRSLITARTSIIDAISSQRTVSRKVRDFWYKYKRLGLNLQGNGSNGSKVTTVNIGELENFLKMNAVSKQSDVAPFPITDGSILQPEDNLVLLPKRAMIEGRDGNILDIDAYASIGVYNAQDLSNWFSVGHTGNSIFSTYGDTPHNRNLRLNTHSLRHLKTTELLRYGVSDAAIAKHQNRKDIRQNQDYDHRSLLEDLENIDIPDDALDILPEKAQTTLRLILTGRARGPIVERFIKIRETEGEAVAFEYLAAEADGFHVTPFGYCLKNFMISSCPKHLQCVKNCGHFARSDNPAHDSYIIRTRERTQIALDMLRQNPMPTIGYHNQIKHAEELIEGLDAALATKPGDKVFPNGKDLYEDGRVQSSLLDMGDTSKINLELFDD